MMTTGQKVMLGLGLGAVAYAVYSVMSKKEAKAYMSMDTAGGAARKPELGPLPAPAIAIASVVKQYAPTWDGTQWVVTGDIKTVQGQLITRSSSVPGKPNQPPTQAAIMAALLAPSPQASIEL